MTDGIGRAEVLWVALGQVFTLLLGILALKALTSLLGAEDYGRFALGLTAAGALNLFVYGPIGHAVARYFHLSSEGRDRDELSRMVSVLMVRSAAILAATGVFLAILTGVLAGVEWGGLVAAALGYGVVGGTLSIVLADMNTRRRRQDYALLQVFDALMRLLGAVLLVLLIGATGTVAMSGFLLGSLVATSFALVRQRAHGRGRAGMAESLDQGVLARPFARYAFSIAVFAVPGLFAGYGDRWIIHQWLSETHVGIYVALAQIANAPANLVLAIFSQSVNPVIFQRAGESASPDALHGGRRVLYRALLLLVTVLALMTLVSYAFGEWIVTVLTSPEFTRYAGLLWVLVLSAAIFQIGQALASEAFLYNRPSLLFLPKLIHALTFLGLSAWLISDRQLAGVAIAALVAAVIYVPLVVLMNARMARSLKQRLSSAAGVQP
jgi:O-antigen/teichoic acid export membrane protein